MGGGVLMRGFVMMVATGEVLKVAVLEVGVAAVVAMRLMLQQLS